MTTATTMNSYHLLGRSGLRVSPLALGVMTFGQDEWGTDDDASRAIFDGYLEAGGNFIDTADAYARGRSEEMLGRLIRDSRTRDQIVLATKFSQGGDMLSGTRNPNWVGNGRKNMIAALDGSLRRLQTDYVDLYWMHIWDTVTPVEEVMSTFDTLVRGGKVRAVGLSNVPSWYAARAQTLAAARGWEPVAALQMEYSLVERAVEREHVPAALHLGMGVVPWAPLAGGFLTGKYRRDGDEIAGQGRLDGDLWQRLRKVLGGFGERYWRTLDVLKQVAAEVDRSPAQVAINWVTKRPGVAATLIGASSLRQLDANVAALGFELSPDQSARLDTASAPESAKLYLMYQRELQQAFLTPGYEVVGEPAWYRG